MSSNIGKGAATAALTTNADTLAELAGDPDPNTTLNRNSGGGEQDTIAENEEVGWKLTSIDPC